MFDEKTRCVLATYEVHDAGEGRSYEFVSCRQRVLSADNWQRKLNFELEHTDVDHATVVAYERADGSTSFEGNSYAVVAIEREPGGKVTEWYGDEIAEEIQYW
jgi:hypothetical protein